MQTTTKSENRSAGRSGSQLLLSAMLALVLGTLILGLLTPCVARGAALRNAVPVCTAPGLPFTIADFNGDQRPDFARVLDGGEVTAHGYDYAIWIQLSGSGRTLIRLVAPSGGLSIEARDVNGDHAVDLVLSTAWLKQPVAILLNDGHGRFSRVAPNAYPAAFSSPKVGWQASANQTIEPIALAQESWGASPVQASGAIAISSDGSCASAPRAQFRRTSFAASCAGRAPPASLLSL
ncbi:MAG TPA: VCBS repeat-containing protein [Candidatus Acidoferrum sp.]|nr:VCBS repeat-containing protein [Candidatus Acidoferrum sp.]